MGPPETPMPYMPPPRRRPRWLGALIGIVVIAVLVVAFFLLRNQLSGNVTDLQVGDCIDQPATTGTVTDVQHHPCTDAHDAEVFTLITDSTSGDYPGQTHFETIANTQCFAAASAYLGTDFNARDDIGGGFFYPSTDSWSSGDRTVTCYLDRTDGGQLTGSLRGIGASPLPAS